MNATTRSLRFLLSLLAAGALASLAAAGTTLELEGDDSMQYSKNRLEAPAGEEITLRFKNVGSLPKSAMGHNVVILEPGSDPVAFGNKGAMARDHDYIPQDEASQSKIIAHTELLGPGEEDAIAFTLPEPGKYVYVCTFPGHAALMNGILVAK